jgi:hypothetical protein
VTPGVADIANWVNTLYGVYNSGQLTGIYGVCLGTANQVVDWEDYCAMEVNEAPQWNSGWQSPRSTTCAEEGPVFDLGPRMGNTYALAVMGDANFDDDSITFTIPLGQLTGWVYFTW